MNIRALAARAIYDVLERGISLSVSLPAQQANTRSAKDKALLAELCYGVMRRLPQLDKIISNLMEKPFKGKQRIIHQLLLVGAYQLYFTRVPPHAAIAETAEACRALRFEKLVKVVNGVLRSIQRQQPALDESNDTLKYNFPAWIIRRLKTAYPAQWQDIVDASQQRPPMWLRNNIRRQPRDSYLDQLMANGIHATAVQGDNAILLDAPTDVNRLPGFAEGDCSVQDGAAQWAASLLGAENGELILDACAAPGGKSCHLLELADIELVAVDADNKRLERVTQNLQRLGLSARVMHGDAGNIGSWWQGDRFDRILLDAPCSATGVIRRHPDIKWLRQDKDILELSTLQQQILDNCWYWLKPGGTLLYATCSILPDENRDQIAAFLARTPDATLETLPQQSETDQIGWQILPGQDNMDGFYYARLKKSAE